MSSQSYCLHSLKGHAYLGSMPLRPLPLSACAATCLGQRTMRPPQHGRDSCARELDSDARASRLLLHFLSLAGSGNIMALASRDSMHCSPHVPILSATRLQMFPSWTRLHPLERATRLRTKPETAYVIADQEGKRDSRCGGERARKETPSA
eukprot:3367605-Rhodomonas_salina.2